MGPSLCVSTRTRRLIESGGGGVYLRRLLLAAWTVFPAGLVRPAGDRPPAAAGSLWSWVALGRTVRSAGSMSSVGGQADAVLGAVTPVALWPGTGVPA